MSVTPAAPDTPSGQVDIHYRVVSNKEMAVLTPLFTKLGWVPPDPDFAKVVVAEAGEGDSGIILGFCVVQFVPHAEPFWVHPDMRGSGVAELLMEHVTSYIEKDSGIKRYLSTAKPGSFGARLCERNGMIPFPGQVYVKQVDDKVKG